MRNGIMCILAVLSLYSIFSISLFIYNEYKSPIQTSYTQSTALSETQESNSSHTISRARDSFSLVLDEKEEDEDQISQIIESEALKLITREPLFLEEYSEPILYEPPETTCKLKEFELTEEEYKKIYNFKEYGPCTTPTDDVIYFDGDSIFAECVEGDPLFVVDPGLPQVFGGEKKDEVEWVSDSTIGPKSEYAFIKCGESLYSLFFLRFNQSTADRANLIRKSQKHDSRPMNVLLLVMDSISRFTFYKYLPKLTQFFNTRMANPSNFADFSVYEFKKIGLPEIFTIPNTAQLLYGVDFEDMRKLLDIKKPGPGPDSEKHIKFQTEKSIWNYYSRLGYTTLFLADTIFDFITRFTGRQIQADHVFSNYWRSAWTVYGYNDFSNTQRCMGRQNSHNLTLGYVYEYFEKYSDNNKFAYVHLDAAHEATGNVQTVDADLLHFIESLYKLIEKRGENLVLSFITDHGFKFAELMLDVRSFAEATSPLGYFMISKRVENKLKARENLLHNSEMLTGRFDLNLVLKYLAYFPYEMPGKKYFDDIKKEYKVKSVVNWLTEKASPTRDCSDLGVPKHRCICSWFEPINKKNKWQKEVLSYSKPLIERYLKETSKKKPCKSLEHIKLVSGQKFEIHDLNKGRITFFELKFKVNNSTNLQAKFTFCYPKKVKRGMNRLEGFFNPYVEYHDEDVKLTAFLQLTDVVTDGLCEGKKCVC